MPRYSLPNVERMPVTDSSRHKRRRVVLVAFQTGWPGELIGPMDFLNEANVFLNNSGHADWGYDLEVVSTQAGPLFSQGGLTISVDRTYKEVRGDVDTLIVHPVDDEEACLNDPDFIRWLRTMSGQVRRLATVCVGTYVLAQAGLLNGRRATTHWAACEDFKQRYPEVRLDPDPIYIKDGHIYTSAGATSGLDMTLALIEEDFGKELALRVAQGMVMFLKRPGNQSQFSVQISNPLPESRSFDELRAYIADHPDAELNVESLADRVGMSPRNFSRVFTKQMGMSPGRFVEIARLERARHWLEQSDSPIGEVARRCGYGTSDGLRLAFDRHLGVSPREYRQRFATAARV